MKLYLRSLGSKGEILMQDVVEIDVGHASEKELQDYVLHRFQYQDLSERCRRAVKSIEIYTKATELKL